MALIHLHPICQARYILAVLKHRVVLSAFKTQQQSLKYALVYEGPNLQAHNVSRWADINSTSLQAVGLYYFREDARDENDVIESSSVEQLMYFLIE